MNIPNLNFVKTETTINARLGLYLFVDKKTQIFLNFGYKLDEAISNFPPNEEKKIIGGLTPLVRYDAEEIIKKIKFFVKEPTFKRMVIVEPKPKIDTERAFINCLYMAADKFVKDGADKSAIQSILSKIQYGRERKG